MKRLVVMAAAACAAFSAFGIAASQAWVSNYVASVAASVQAGTYAVSTNGSMVVTANGGMDGEMRLVVEDFTDAALVATNCLPQAVSAGVTNGLLFVWNGAGAYVNPAGTVSCTPTNLVWNGVSSITTNGVERFEGWFDAYGGIIQPHTSLAITNGMTEVTQ